MKALLIVLATVCWSARAQFFGGGGGKRPSNPLGGFPNPIAGAQNIANTVPGAQNLANAVPGAQALSSLFEGQWQDFLKGKNYDPSELLLRKNIFVENAAKIADFAQKAGTGAVNFALKMNPLGDLSFLEFNKFYNGFKGLLAKGSSKAAEFKPKEEPIPESIDWRELGAVTPIKNQQKCAGCWAFSVAGALEGHNFKKTGKLEEVSIQNLLDCSKGKSYGNDGCAGGLVETAFDYVQDNRGINKASSYPYEAKDGSCRFQSNDIAANCTGYVRIPEGDEKSLEKAVATVGPVAVAIHVVELFQFYGDGVFYDPKCGNKPENLNHAVLLVGYGKEPNGQKYWLVKNSYGPEWGQQGYFKLAKDVGNHCGIATYARFPIV